MFNPNNYNLSGTYIYVINLTSSTITVYVDHRCNSDKTFTIASGSYIATSARICGNNHSHGIRNVVASTGTANVYYSYYSTTVSGSTVSFSNNGDSAFRAVIYIT